MATSRDPVPLNIDLNGTKLSLIDGEWKLTEATANVTSREVPVLQDEVKKLASERDNLKRELESMAKSMHLLEFKNQLLFEMLAVAQLDAEKNAEEWQKEQLKVDALKWKLSKVTLAQNVIEESEEIIQK
eukprot:TRINITY_DN780563_c0_g1_i1.p1 TRINITY_DN780563_c0_g1~~TRINITY_DN780563_c0_g1_i1.p1  ORF type:complete len:130 (-),score=28.09 TRINITY_DN780563_c0_g1_i1:139-528(-)